MDLTAVCPSVQAEEMINEIRSEFKKSLDKLSWMDDQTRQAAKDKVRFQMCSLYQTININRNGKCYCNNQI